MDGSRNPFTSQGPYSPSATEVPERQNDNLYHMSYASNGASKNEGFGLISPMSEEIFGSEASRRPSLEDINYFYGPLDPLKHSKLPYYLRMRGSILPVMIVPILFVATWATIITCFSKYVFSLAVDSVLLIVLGFVVGLSLSFRSATAYERYMEGRKFWQLLILHSRNLARIIWIHAKERGSEAPEAGRTDAEIKEAEANAKEDLLAKLTAINLILAFTQSVKHKLRHEIEYDYVDLKPLIENLNTFAKSAQSDDSSPVNHNKLFIRKVKTWGTYLGIPFFQSNPAKPIKNALIQGKHHGNLPFEIMTYLAAYLQHITADTKTLTQPCWLTQASASQLAMMDAYGGCDRVLHTPMPLAYSIAISQITWLYVLLLPFQLYPKLDWITVPGTVIAAYIILGIAAIGHQIENLFGRDKNDLDLGRYCDELKMDLSVLTSQAPPKINDWIKTADNLPLWPYPSGYDHWSSKSVKEIRSALMNRVEHHLAAFPVDSSTRTEVVGTV